MHDPDTIVRAAARTLDLGQPVALTLVGVLGHAADYDTARAIVTQLLDALPSGSYLALNDATDVNETFAEAQRVYNESAVPYHLRSPGQVAGFFEGLELVEPGVVSCLRWRPDATISFDPIVEETTLCGVGRKPIRA